MSNSVKARPLNRSSGLRQRPRQRWGYTARLTAGFNMTKRERTSWIQDLKDGLHRDRREADNA